MTSMDPRTEDTRTIQRSRGLLGTVALPADKSIAHRAAMFSALGSGVSHIVGFPDSADPQSTLACLRQLGVRIEGADAGLVVYGEGLSGLSPASLDLDCGNSGTTMRLLAGILAGQSFSSTLIGDASLSARPMGRVMDPLAQMGAHFDSNAGRAPLRIIGGHPLKGIEYVLPVASAQVKSCVLLAGYFAEGTTTVIETTPTRDHTERMLGLSNFTIGTENHIFVDGGRTIEPRLWSIPADFSAAAFFLVAGSIVPDSVIHLPRVGLNPSRTGFIDILRAMGANITIENERLVSGEPIADLTVRSARLVGIQVGGEIIANIIDEIPILAVAASVADGETVIREAAELRHKETDRISAMATGLNAIGAQVTEQEDGLTIRGNAKFHGGTVESHHDHRIAMAMAIAGLVSSKPVTIRGASVASVSFPSFWEAIEKLS